MPDELPKKVVYGGGVGGRKKYNKINILCDLVDGVSGQESGQGIAAAWFSVGPYGEVQFDGHSWSCWRRRRCWMRQRP